ncbi:MAG: gliding motility-associated C-terminal domain-containing protein [Bacteroidetes bacterium]|nr:gliding motility-associated C-terminal domain-containing protein [Bacteroidota bacterium]
MKINQPKYHINSYKWILLLFVFAGSFNAKADHIIGSDFSYSCSSTNDSIFEIVYNFYRDCNGCYVLGQSPKCGTSENCASASTAPTSMRVTCLKGGRYSSTLTMKRTSIVDITKTCKKVKSRCAQPCNGTFPYGIEKHTFKGTLDLRQAIKNGCCNIEISALLYVRSALITTGQQQQPFYTSCEINLCDAKCNTSPTLTNDPVAILCCNQPYVFNNGAVDFADNDSISYSFAPAFRAQNQQTSYNGSRSPANPISVYYPGTLKFPYCNPNANPPIGICLDPLTGDVIFTPTKCGEIAVVVIQMTEWRKDSTGKYKKIGVTRRDMQFIVMSCPDNNPPKITNTKYTFRVCEAEQVCFNVTTEDKVKKPPPPALPPDPDTVQLRWNRGIPGATFTITNPTARLKTGRFCWTPPVGTSSSLPYTFTATVSDDACPLAASATRAFQIYVDPMAEAKRDIDTFDCGKYSVLSTPFPNFLNPPKYRWQLMDTAGNIIFNKTIANFQSTGSFLSTQQTDTIQFRRGGTYVIQHVISNRPKCETYYYDTLVVPPLLEVDLAFGPDTFVCESTTLRLDPKILNSSPPVQYTWDNGDTTQYRDVEINAPTTDSVFRVEIKDKSGCTAWDSTIIFLKPNPHVTIGPDRRICTYDSIQLFPNDSLAYWDDPRDTFDAVVQGDTLYYEWYKDGVLISQDSALQKLNVAGEYVIKVIDSIGCYDMDTVQLQVNDTVTAYAGIDRSVCWDDFIKLVATELDTAGNNKTGYFQWWDITNPPTRIDSGGKDTLAYNIRNSTEYQLELFVTEDTTTCYDNDSIFINVKPLPVYSMANDMEVCYDAGDINLRLLEDSKAKNGTWTCPTRSNMINQGYIYQTDSSGAVDNSVTDVLYYSYTDPSTGCIKTDSMEIKVNPLPKVDIRDGYYCQDKNVVDVVDDRVINLPGGATLSLGRQAWKCIDCGSYTESDIIKDEGSGNPGAPQDFKIYVNKNVMPLGGKNSDSVIVEFEFRNVFGCYNRDTATITVAEVPEIKYNGLPDLCWDHGIEDLKISSKVSPYDGIWRAVDSTGFAGAAGLNAALKGDTLNGDTLNTILTPQPPEGGSFTYMMRYHHDRSGCPTYRDTTLTIRGLPIPIIDTVPFVTSKNEGKSPFAFCESDGEIDLRVNYSGGVWSSSESSAISGAKFDPSQVANPNTRFNIAYSYNDIHGCQGKDSIDIIIHQEHTLDIPRDTAICRTDNMSKSVTATYTNSSGVIWIPLGGTTVDDNLADQTTYRFSNTTDTVYRHILVAQTLENTNNVCPVVEATMVVNVHPKPVVAITADTLDGCNPVDVTFTTSVLNKIDPTQASYDWTYADGGTDNIQNPTHTFTQDGPNSVDVTITSAFGCDTNITLNVDVYPIPLAAFTPDPNNSTTAALPKFQFNNQSTVNGTWGSNLSEHLWDFGVLNQLDDTSTEENPLYFYPSDTGTYDVTLTVRTQYGCASDITHQVIIGPDILVYIPNAFSPDGGGPGENEGFRAVVNDGAKDYHLVIFNRWGEVIWETKDKEAEWDGKYGRTDGWNGDPNTKGSSTREPVSQDVYAYYLRIVSWDGEEYKYAGTVTVVR